jgi:hypothetical protein
VTVKQNNQKVEKNRTNLLDANITLIQKKGSELFDVTTPYKGIWQHTKKMNKVTIVHRAFSLNGIYTEKNEILSAKC